MDFNSLSLFKEFFHVKVLSQLRVSVFSFGTLGSAGLGAVVKTAGAVVETAEEVVETAGAVVEVAGGVLSGESSNALSLHCRKFEADIVMYWL